VKLTADWSKLAPWAAWLILATPAIAQLFLLFAAIGGRFLYPYDLEWMEGGLLHHAQRIADGEGIYGPPSVEFIPYLYTPLYPGILGVLGSMFGLSYQLGRAISILSLFGIGALTISILMGGSRQAQPAVRASSLCGALLALGLFAASYPYVEGWYDLVRADTFFLFLITAGISVAHRTARTGTGFEGHGRTAAAAAILALAFFTKQTGILFVAAAGVIVLVFNWRRAPTFALVAGAIGLGGTALMQRATGGWFWTYVYEVHQVHDWNIDRFWMALEDILWRYPAMSLLLGVTLVVIGVTVGLRRRLPPEARTFLVWLFVFCVSTLTGMLGFATEFAHKNAYIPALLHGAIAAGAALPALAACTTILIDAEPVELGKPLPTPEWGDAGAADRTAPITVAAAEHVLAPAKQRARRAFLAAQGIAAAAALALGVTLIDAWWKPGKFIPTDADERAGDELIERIAAVEGEVWVPSHPWYAHLAGKSMYVHRMGVKDVTVRKPRTIVGLEDALRRHYFAAIVLDDRDLHQHGEVGALGRYYQEEDVLPKDEQPRTVTGAIVHPTSIWVPAGPPKLPAGGNVVFDFEGDVHGWGAWTVEGTAWGSGTVGGPLLKQGPVRRAGGRRWVSSMHGGDGATGVLTSPEFPLVVSHLWLRVGGGTDAKLRVELLVDGVVVRTLTPPAPASERFRDVDLDVTALIGKNARLRFVDEATGGWGHLNVDEIWAVPYGRE
jgi:hypothetical protein